MVKNIFATYFKMGFGGNKGSGPSEGLEDFFRSLDFFFREEAHRSKILF